MPQRLPFGLIAQVPGLAAASPSARRSGSGDGQPGAATPSARFGSGPVTLAAGPVAGRGGRRGPGVRAGPAYLPVLRLSRRGPPRDRPPRRRPQRHRAARRNAQRSAVCAGPPGAGQPRHRLPALPRLPPSRPRRRRAGLRGDLAARGLAGGAEPPGPRRARGAAPPRRAAAHGRAADRRRAVAAPSLQQLPGAGRAHGAGPVPDRHHLAPRARGGADRPAARGPGQGRRADRRPAPAVARAAFSQWRGHLPGPARRLDG